MFDHTQQHPTAAGASSPLLPAAPDLTVSAATGSSVQATDLNAALKVSLRPTPGTQQHTPALQKAQDDDPNEGKGFNLTQLGQQFNTISQQLGAAWATCR